MYKISILIIILTALLSIFIHSSGNEYPKFQNNYKNVIIDCHFTLTQALANKRIPTAIEKNLRLVNVFYYSFDGKLHEGQLVIHKDLVNDIKEIFKIIESVKFPIAKAVPIIAYNWSDDSSMKHNNTSAFNYRYVKGTHRLSYHAYGRAIDINPLINPQITKNKVIPNGNVYNSQKPGTLTRNSIIVKAFLKRGWIWGGNWHSTKDYQHFEKKIK